MNKLFLILLTLLTSRILSMYESNGQNIIPPELTCVEQAELIALKQAQFEQEKAAEIELLKRYRDLGKLVVPFKCPCIERLKADKAFCKYGQ